MLANVVVGSSADAGKFSRDTYAAIGRVTVAAASVDFGLAILVVMLEMPNDTADLERAFAIVERPGEAHRRAKKIGEQLQGAMGMRWNALVEEAGTALKDRHGIVHAVWSRQSDELQATGYIGYHPRTMTEVVADPAQIGAIADRLVTVQDSIFWMIVEIGLVLGDEQGVGGTADISRLNPDLAAIDERVENLRRRSEEAQ